MENNIGKICPFCKTEITETDTVKECPVCGIPHHEDCWNENGGCTTFGCSGKDEAPVAEVSAAVSAPAATEFCSACGTPVTGDGAFCTGCGAPKAPPVQRSFCSKCGAELQDGQQFCSVCGQRAGLSIDPGVNSAIYQFNADLQKTNEAKKKLPVKIVTAAVAAVVVILLSALVLPKIFVSVDGLCAQGNYEKAYSKASGEEKEDVIKENNIAVCADIAVDAMKDPGSFELVGGWYNPDKGYVVLKISGNNSYGDTIVNYWLFCFDHKEDKEWEIWDEYSNLVDSEYSKYDDSDELTEKLLENIGKGRVRESIKTEYELDDDGLERINGLFRDDKLDEIEQIDAAIPEEPETTASAD